MRRNHRVASNATRNAITNSNEEIPLCRKTASFNSMIFDGVASYLRVRT